MGVGESITLNSTSYIPKYYNKNIDGMKVLVEDDVLITETLVISYQGEIPTKATGEYGCD